MQCFEEIKEKAGEITYFKVRLFPRENKEPLKVEDLMKKFRLQGSISIKNMNLLDENMKLKNYDNTKTILREFSENQLSFYGKKKRDKVAKLERDIKSLYYKIVFIELLNMKKNSPLTTFMEKTELLSIFKEKLSEKKEQGEHNYPEEHNHDDVYNFVKSMPIGTLFDDDDSLPKMKDERKRMKEELENLEHTTPETLWLNDLERFESIAKNLLPEVYTSANED
ncbi:DNA topoisomerase 2-like [Vicia villosa]|uniref:DNA topoisomerase 2-like n=1 Tax=Vicia villosa TaxID=3911 RepID=UPI00273BF351|nr:DNA topoisomerase 2-like [Vicia villosa]